MKNKDAKRKGFFIALYACLGSVMVLALVISFSNLAANDRGQTGQAQAADSGDETVNANADMVKSYLEAEAEANAEAEASMEEAWFRSKQPTATPMPTATPTPAPTATPIPPTATPAPVTNPATSSPETLNDAGTTSGPTAGTTSEQPEALAFTPFSEGDEMVWPVTGELVMTFSSTPRAYDPTLDQYRANKDIRITAQEGTPVKACADGLVVAIDRDNVYGNYVVLDNGDGWRTYYGQLMDGLLVAEGDIVKAGQVIGGVAKPSYYGSLIGTHMNLRVSKDDEFIDPQSVLASLD